MNAIKNIISKFLTKEIIFYGLFGILTTVINLLTFYILNSLFQINENLSNIVAILLAVLFAYFTNRKLVFNSTAATSKDKLIEFLKFMLGRVFTMIVEFVGCAILFDILDISDMIIKVFMTILIVILNFFISKFFAFKK